MRDLFNVHVSEGTLNNIVAKAHNFLEKTEASIKASIRASPVMHMDETGMYVVGNVGGSMCAAPTVSPIIIAILGAVRKP